VAVSFLPDQYEQVTLQESNGLIIVSSERAAAADDSAIARLSGHNEDAGAFASVTTIMKLSDEYEDLDVKLDRAHLRCDETLALPLFDNDADPA
jgi:hypothetical protein